MNRPIDSIAVGKRTRKKMGDIHTLVASINELGLLHPIVIDDHNNLIAGQRRLEACKSLGWDEVPVHVVPLDNILRGEFDENVVREDFRPSERYAIEEAVTERERRAAKDRQREHGGTAPGKGKNTGGNFPQATGKSRDKVAKFTGSNARTNKKVREICEAAKAEPEKYQPLVDEMDRTGRVNGVHRKLKVAKQVEQIQAEPLKPPDAKFRVLVVDPPGVTGVHRTQDIEARAHMPQCHLMRFVLCRSGTGRTRTAPCGFGPRTLSCEKPSLVWTNGALNRKQS